MVREFEDGKGMAIWIIRHERKAKSGVIMYNTFKCVAWEHLKDVAMGLSKGDFIQRERLSPVLSPPRNRRACFPDSCGHHTETQSAGGFDRRARESSQLRLNGEMPK